MKKILIVVAFFVVACPARRAAGATYYVSKTGGAVGCAAATNRNTPIGPNISDGVNCLSAGDTLRIRAGVYSNGLNDLITNGGGMTVPVKVVPNGTSESVRTIIEADPTDFANSRYSSIIRPTGITADTYRPVEFENFSQYITIRNLKIDANGTANQAVDLVGPSSNHLILEGNDITGSHSNNANVGGDSTIVRGNHIHHNINTNPPDGQKYGLYTNGTNIVIENNEIDNSQCYGMHLYGGTIQDSFIVRNNYFHDNALANPCNDVIVAGANHQFYNNVFYNSAHGAVLFFSGPTNIELDNNTFYNVGNGSSGCSGFVAPCVIDVRGSSHRFKNNLFLSSTTAFQENGASSITYSNNLCDSMSSFCTFSSTSAMEFINSSDPTMSNFLHLKMGATSIANGANLTGTIPSGSGCPPLSPSTDKDGVTRPCSTAWDIGAYQVVAGSPPNTPPVEDFVYPVGVDLNGGTLGINWTGPWVIVAGCSSPMTIAAAMPGTFTAGNAVKSSATSGFACYSRLFTEVGTGIIPWQMRNSVNNSGYRAVELQDVGGTTHAVVIAQKNDGHIHACADYANDTDLGTYNANQTYWMRVELNVSTNMGAYRVSIDNGTFSSWINFCQTPPSSQVGKMVLVDNPITIHDWWVDSIGAKETTLAFTTQPPAAVTTDVAFAANVSVTYSNGSTPVPGTTNSIILTVCPSSPTATLSAASGLTKAAVNGTASWTDLVLSQPAGAVGVTLCANSGTLTQGVSTAITVNASASLSEIATPPRVQARIR